MDFSFPLALVYPTATASIFPITLMLVTRIAPLRSRNAAQFVAGALLHIIAVLLGSLLLPERFRLNSPWDWACAGMITATALLFYLEVWALLSRGYTLSMLLTLQRARRPLTSEQLAREYRGGAGLGWVMQHRVGDLEAAGLIRPEGDQLTLTRPAGTLIAIAYQVAIAAFGLRRTG